MITVDRAAALAAGALLLVAALAWARVLSTPMHADDMAGSEMVMTPTLADGVAYVAAWAVMMTAMMLPSALPMIALYAATQRRTERATARIAAITIFALAYVALWAATGVPIYLASVALMAVTVRTLAYVTAGVLVAAGLYQISPLKSVCLRHCRSPLGFLLGRWRDGWRGGATMGAEHALYCVGCCWALMLVLVVAGAMGLPWVLAISAVVAAEKLLPVGPWVARLMGVMLVILGAAVAARPTLALVLRAGQKL